MEKKGVKQKVLRQERGKGGEIRRRQQVEQRKTTSRDAGGENESGGRGRGHGKGNGRRPPDSSASGKQGGTEQMKHPRMMISQLQKQDIAHGKGKGENGLTQGGRF